MTADDTNVDGVFGMARQEGLEPPTHSLEGCRSIQLSYWRNGRIGAPPAERR